MIISGAVVHCPNERTQPSRPLDLTPTKPSRLDRAGLKSTMYAGTGSRLRNVSAAKSNPLHLSLRAQVCTGKGPPLSQSSGRAKTFFVQLVFSIVRALQHPTVFASIETTAHANKQRDVPICTAIRCRNIATDTVHDCTSHSSLATTESTPSSRLFVTVRQ
jgi:hypothetical protein